MNSDQQDKGLETQVAIDRDTAARLGINVAQIDNTLYDAYGQRQVSTIYKTRQRLSGLSVSAQAAQRTIEQVAEPCSRRQRAENEYPKTPALYDAVQRA